MASGAVKGRLFIVAWIGRPPAGLLGPAAAGLVGTLNGVLLLRVVKSPLGITRARCPRSVVADGMAIVFASNAC